jgi:hypothetical protein
MKPAGLAARSAPALLPLTLLLVPKCPLCLLALFAVVGSALPSARVLDGIVVATALGWLAILFLKHPSLPSRAAGLAGVALLLAGRSLGVPSASWIGALALVAVVLRARLGAPEAAAPQAVHCLGAAASGPRN